MNCNYCSFENEDVHDFNRYCGQCRRPVQRDDSGRHTPVPLESFNIPVVFDNSTICDGKTQVKVFRKEEKGQTREIHEGIVLQQTSHFVRVYNPISPVAGGDISPEMSQLFPIKSNNCWIEVIGQEERALLVPPLFR